MVVRRARPLFAAWIAIGLLPLFWTAGTGAAEARAHAAMAWMQFQAKAPSAAQTVRAGSTDAIAHHPTATPFAPADPFSLGATVRRSEVVPSVERALRTVARARLHPARAPPAIP